MHDDDCGYPDDECICGDNVIGSGGYVAVPVECIAPKETNGS